MPNYNKNSDYLVDYVKNQFEIFKKETGMVLLNKINENFLKEVSDKVEEIAQEKKDEFVLLNASFATNDVISYYAYEYLDQLLSQDNNLRLTKPYSDNNFAKIVESFSKCMTNITQAYKEEHKIVQNYNTDINLATFTDDQLSGLYKTCNGGATKYAMYQNKYKNLTYGVSHSAVMCQDANDLIKSISSDDDIQKLAGVYKSLKEKQKKNSIFTNWFSKKGYNERKAMKDIEKALKLRLGCKNTKAFESRMDALATQKPSAFSIIKETKAEDFIKGIKANPFNDYKQYDKALKKKDYLETQLRITQQVIKDPNKEVEQIEVNLGDENEISTSKEQKLPEGLIQVNQIEEEKEIQQG